HRPRHGESAGGAWLRRDAEGVRRPRHDRRPRRRDRGVGRARRASQRRSARSGANRRVDRGHDNCAWRPRHRGQQRRRSLLRRRGELRPRAVGRGAGGQSLGPVPHTIRLSLPAMQANGWGRIINMASIYSHFATVNRIDYITTKTALLGLTRAVALECARTAITCNAVCPGTVLTPAIEWRLRQEMQRDGTTFEDAEASFLSIRQPSRRFVKDDDVAGLIAFLCGPHSGDINGAAFPIDGGWLAGR